MAIAWSLVERMLGTCELNYIIIVTNHQALIGRLQRNAPSPGTQRSLPEYHQIVRFSRIPTIVSLLNLTRSLSRRMTHNRAYLGSGITTHRRVQRSNSPERNSNYQVSLDDYLQRTANLQYISGIIRFFLFTMRSGSSSQYLLYWSRWTKYSKLLNCFFLPWLGSLVTFIPIHS